MSEITTMTTTEQNLVPVVNYGDVLDMVSEAERQNENAVFVYEDPKGNKAARSHIYTLRQVKGRVEARRKELGKAALEYKRGVDEQGKELISRIDAMIEVHAEPLRQIEEREASRVAEIRARIDAMKTLAQVDPSAMPKDIETALQSVKDVDVDKTFMEFMAEAQMVKDAAIEVLESVLDSAVTREREREAERKEAERKQREAEEAAEKAERDRIAAEERAERAERERILAEKRAKEEAEAEAKRAKEEEEARKADKAHRDRVMSEVIEALLPMAGISAAQIAQAIADGEIPHVALAF